VRLKKDRVEGVRLLADMIMTVEDTHSSLHTRPTLLFRLRNWEDEQSWNEFYRLYYNFVFDLARRNGLSRADAEEVTQDVFRRVAETIHQFESDPARGTFRGWLMNLTRWRIADKFRARQPHEKQPPSARAVGLNTDDRTCTIERLPDQAFIREEATDEAEWQRHVLDAALSRLARRVPAKHIQVFDLYARQNWPVFRVARELGINPASVYVINHRLTKQLKIEVEQLQKKLQ
jgi:RNA polymerase sigma factor (sigma-70 family)